VGSSRIPPRDEETAHRPGKTRKLLVAILASWKTTLIFIFAIWFGWHERFWRDPVYRFTIPLVLFLTSLPALDALGFSFVPFLRRLRTLWRRR
jgi:hypothetical protein